MLNYQLQIVGDEFVTSIGHDYEFYVNLFFDRSIYRPMCTHMGKSPEYFCSDKDITGLRYHLVLLVSFLSVGTLSTLEHYSSLNKLCVQYH